MKVLNLVTNVTSLCNNFILYQMMLLYRHIDKHNVAYHGNDAIGRPQKFNYAPHLTEDL